MLVDISKAIHMSLRALVSNGLDFFNRYIIDFFGIFFFFKSIEIPRVINAMMTQNEAPEQPNEDPTYERYQSSEQKGKNINLI